MKDWFFRLCIGCFCVVTVNFLYGFYSGFFDRADDPYARGFFGCLAWWIVIDSFKTLGWLKD